MAVTHIQSQAATGGGITQVQKAITPTRGNILFVCGSAAITTTENLSVADTAGNTWTTVESKTTQSTSIMQSWYAVANASSSTTITVSVDGTAENFMFIMIDEFAGQSIRPIDNHAKATGSGTPTVNITPVLNNCGLWVPCNDSNTAVGAGFTLGCDDANQDLSEWQILSGGAGSPQTCNFTGSGNFIIFSTSIAPAIIYMLVHP